MACATIYPLGDDAPSIPESAFIVPEAPLIGEVVLAERTSVWSGVVLRLAQSAADYARRRERCKLQLKCIG